jgi:hypothetical protein
LFSDSSYYRYSVQVVVPTANAVTALVAMENVNVQQGTTAICVMHVLLALLAMA